jgi:hypothetical protein
MVKLHVKRGDESQFLYNTTVDKPVEEIIEEVTVIYNGRLKISRICDGELLLQIYSCVLRFRLVRLCLSYTKAHITHCHNTIAVLEYG